MTTKVTVTNEDEMENPEHIVVVRTYFNKGNTVDDGVTLQPGESHTAYLHNDSFIQVDEAVNTDYVEPARSESGVEAGDSIYPEGEGGSEVDPVDPAKSDDPQFVGGVDEDGKVWPSDEEVSGRTEPISDEEAEAILASDREAEDHG